MDASVMIKLLMSTSLWLCLTPIILVCSADSVPAEEKVCTIQPGGKVTSFSGDTAHVTLPCKYLLTEMRCGDFRVKVVPGSAADGQGRINLSTVRVKVVNIFNGVNATIRTSMAIMAGQRPSIQEAYVVKEGDLSKVGKVEMDGTSSFLRFYAEDQYSVELNRDAGTVHVKCSSHIFTARPVPDSLCGDGTTQDAFRKAAEAMSGDTSHLKGQAFLHYVILSDVTITQSKTCTDLVSKFQSCDKKTLAVQACSAIFAEPATAECLAQSDTPLDQYYRHCLTARCEDDVTALYSMYQFMVDNCEFGGSPVQTTPESETVCPKGWLNQSCKNDSMCPAANSQCVNQTYCSCAFGYFYSESSQCCVKTCDELYTGDTFDSFIGYGGLQPYCGEGVLLNDNLELEGCLNACLQRDNCVTAIEYKDTKECTLCQFAPGHPEVTLYDASECAYYLRKCV